MYGSCSLTASSSDTVASGVAAANYYDCLVFGADGSVGGRLTCRKLVLGGEVFHCEYDVFISSARDGQIARQAGAHCEADAIKHLVEVAGGDILSDVDAGLKLHALGCKLVEAAVDNVLFEFEVGDAVAEHASGVFVLFEDDDIVSGSCQLLCGGQTGGSGAYDCNAFLRFVFGGPWFDPAFGKPAFDNLKLDMSNQNGLITDGEGTGGLAWCGADPAGDFRKIVRKVKMLAGLPPAVPVNQLVDIGYGVFQGASDSVAERYTAVHAASGLAANLIGRQGQFELFEVVDSLLHGAVAHFPSFVFQEALHFAHWKTSSVAGVVSVSLLSAARIFSSAFR